MTQPLVGFIGESAHAAKLIRAFEDVGIGELKGTFIEHRRSNSPLAVSHLSSLYGCDAIFIASPTHTHFRYLNQLASEYKGYIFCEKPPVSNIEQLDKLNVDPRRTFFNFNYRYSKIFKLIKKAVNEGEIGQILNFSASSTHGLAFKPSYGESWRSKREMHPNGVLETKSIHMIDLAFLLLGEYKDAYHLGSIASKAGTAFDTSQIFIRFENGSSAFIFSSYAAPLSQRICITGTNGIFDFDGTSATLRSPRDSFDSTGQFSEPPAKTIWCQHADNHNIHYDSLKNAIKSFMENVKYKRALSELEFDSCIFTNRFILEL